MNSSPSYFTGVGETKRMRLLGFQRVELAPGESKEVTVTADPRLLRRFDGNARQWCINGGSYKVALGKAADALVLAAQTKMQLRLLGR